MAISEQNRQNLWKKKQNKQQQQKQTNKTKEEFTMLK